MNAKTRVYLIFGGRSTEHEVSLMSARNVLQALDRNKYEVVPIGITKEGRWLLTGDPLKALTEGVTAAGGQPVGLLGDPTQADLLALAESAPALGPADQVVFFPVLHGAYGEDGTIQGLLEMANVPYVGCGVLASSVGMDKGVAKALFQQAGLTVAPYKVYLRRDWERDPAAVKADVEATFAGEFPVFVKPANLGSSVGITKVKRPEDLDRAFAEAVRFDRRILVEKGIDAREIEVAVLGNDDPIASIAGEILPGAEFYDYNDKYFSDRSQVRIPADLPDDLMQEFRRQAVVAFKAIDGSGMARVDFFLERGTNRIYINEVNTIPGFTRISMYPKLWEASGISYSELCDRLIQLALERHADKNRNATSV
ncbi:MAG: D-alanine--D-alanine ligase family protein [Symbiobacterium sp.]|jgi:D-alanine--D-alanine ligase (EC 6.3.2.4)|uniref:D-alanine--D-alanine ligase family protein n=1 Tax=Symbiobacterium sp. TaxID=1971213 RepID=UPI003463EDD0